MGNHRHQAMVCQYLIDQLPQPGFLLFSRTGERYYINKQLAVLLGFLSPSDLYSQSGSIFGILSEIDSKRILNAVESNVSKVTLQNVVVKGKDKENKFELLLKRFSHFDQENTDAWIGSIHLNEKTIPVDNSILNNFYSDKFLDETAIITDFHGNLLCSSREFKSIDFFSNFSDKELNMMKIIHESYHDILIRRIKELKKGVVMPPAEYRLADTDNRPVFIEVHSRPVIYKGEKAILSLIRDITVRKESEKQLLYTVVQTEEKERQKFVRDLHDDLGPFFSGLKLYLNELHARRDDPDRSAVLIRYLSQMIDEAVDKVRMVAYNLTSQNVIGSGLTETVRNIISKLNLTGRIFISFETKGKETNSGSSFIITLYRIILELINNSVKHSKADKITIRLSYTKKSVRLIFEDNGKGFNLQKELKSTQGIGLKSILNRIELYQGKFTFRNNKGIRYSIVFPSNDISPQSK